MSVIAFLGPTLPQAAASARLAADYRAPAGQGDILRAVQQRPRAIVLIDGVFRQVPAVWHREILWAMAHGIHVFGAASMGALRAAELHAYGMVGHGEIFAAYRDGALEDDDEVAVAHGPAELGFAPLSEAMVNVRATLRAAAAAGIVGRASADALVRIAKALYFAERRWPTVLEQARARSVAASELERLAAWLPHGRRDRKRADALGLLERVGRWLAEEPAAKQVAYRFEYTSAWHAALQQATGAAGHNADELATVTAVIEELKLAGGGLFEAVLDGAALRLLAREQAADEPPPGDPELLAAVRSFRQARGLATAADFGAWLRRNRLAPAEVRALAQEERALARARRRIEAQAPARLIDELRARDRLAQLLERAIAKAERLRALERSQGGPGAPPDHELVAWFARSDPQRFCTDQARLETRFRDGEALARAVRREYLFRVADDGAA